MLFVESVDAMNKVSRRGENERCQLEIFQCYLGLF